MHALSFKEIAVHFCVFSIDVCLYRLDIVTLGLNGAMHFCYLVFLSTRILVKVALVFTHIASTHAFILMDHFFFELGKQLIVNVAESLN